MFRLLLLMVGILAVLTLAGCTTQLTPTSTPQPTPTPGLPPTPLPTTAPPTIEPSASPASPTPTPTATVGPTASPEPPSTLVLPALIIVATFEDATPYSRSQWRHWVNTDGNCRDTRHEVLVIESISAVTFREGGECFVLTGHWKDSYTGTDITEASQADVDHMVPLQNAHLSGGWQWDRDRKQDYANYLEYEDHLIAVTAAANRSKGAKGPHEWKPPLESYWCDYAIDWINIKAAWGLAAIEAEWAALLEMLDTCAVEVIIANVDTAGAEPTLTPAATPTAIPTPTPTLEPPCVDINTASLEDLQRIVNIGEARAMETISLRPFGSVEDLSRVSGIGPSRLTEILAQGLACVS